MTRSRAKPRPLPPRPGAWTYDDYARIPDDGQRYEIIWGELYATAAPLLPHQRVILRLGTLVAAHADAHDLGELFIASVDVFLAEGTTVQPDLLFVARARMPALLADERRVTGAPDMVAEVLADSTAALDRSTKRDAYAAHGVPHYWILAPRTRSLEAYELDNGRYELVVRHESADVFTPTLFPGLAIDLRGLWR